MPTTATSTGGAALMIVVNGRFAPPGLNAKSLGPGYRANATINIAAPDSPQLPRLPARVLDKSTQGWAGNTACFAEDRRRPRASPCRADSPRQSWSPWRRRVRPNVLSHGTADPEQLLTCFADAMAGLGSLSPGRTVIVFAPEHAGHLRRAGWTRPQTQQWLYDHAWRSLADLKRGGKVEPAFFASPALVDGLYTDAPGGRPAVLPGPHDAGRVLAGDETVHVHRGLGPDDILLTVGGGDAGGHSAFFPSWSRGRSVPFVTKEIFA
jgi:hypothetical protein